MGVDVRDCPHVNCGGSRRRSRLWLRGIGDGSGSHTDVDTPLRDWLFGDSRTTVAGSIFEGAGYVDQMTGKVFQLLERGTIACQREFLMDRGVGAGLIPRRQDDTVQAAAHRDEVGTFPVPGRVGGLQGIGDLTAGQLSPRLISMTIESANGSSTPAVRRLLCRSECLFRLRPRESHHRWTPGNQARHDLRRSGDSYRSAALRRLY